MTSSVYQPPNIEILGVGGTGSHLGILTALQRFPSRLWDGDIVRVENLRNQAYTPQDLGLPKVVALRHHMVALGGPEPALRQHYIEGPVTLRGIVCLCFDSMQSRLEVWEQSVENNHAVDLCIDVRIDAENVVIVIANPNDHDDKADFRRNWYPDSQARNVRGACGITTRELPTARLAANLAMWQILRYVGIRNGERDALDNVITMTMRPLMVRTEQWSPPSA